MGADVLQFKAKEPDDSHLAGEAKCLACGKEWMAVAAVGTSFLTCPGCGCEKGVMKYPGLYENDPIWTCHCGCDLFRVVARGIYCPNCGSWQEGF